MRRYSKYAPHLTTISETSTTAKEPEPIPEEASAIEREVVRREPSRAGRAQSAPPTRSSGPPPSSRTRSRSEKSLPTCPPPEQPRRVRPASSRAVAANTEPLDSQKVHSQPVDSRPAASQPANKYGRSELHNAVRKGDKAAVWRLVRERPELVREPDARGNHPLHYAANAGVPDCKVVVHLLLQAGAPVNAANDRRQTPLLLYVLSTEDDDDLVPRMLLHHNAKPAIKVTDDYLLPEYAAKRRLFKIAAALREYM